MVTNRKSNLVLLCHILLSVRWLAIDLVLYDAGRTVYWCDSGTNRIEKVDLVTSERTVVLEGVNDCRDLVLVDDDIIFVDNTMTYVIYILSYWSAHLTTRRLLIDAV